VLAVLDLADIRGKILQRLALSSTPLNFPITLSPNAPTGKDIGRDSGKDKKKDKEAVAAGKEVVMFTNTGDLLQECVATYERAYTYFRSVGDDRGIGRTVARIAEAYLARVFAPVALLGLPYEEVARLPFFRVSALAADKSLEKLVLAPVPAPAPDPTRPPSDRPSSTGSHKTPTDFCILSSCGRVAV